MKTYTLKVVEIRKETKESVTICFKQPGLKKIKYEAGQYLTLIFRINGRRYIRPYSFSSSPEIDTYLEVTVKRVPNGIVSNHINQEIKIGDDIEVLTPMGNFIFPKPCAQKDIFLWGVGSGITPLFSILKSILADSDLVDRRVHLIYGNRNLESTIFWNELNQIQVKHLERFQITHFHTSPQEHDTKENVEMGRIQPQKVISNFDEVSIKNSLHFICGPADLKENIKSVLTTYNLPETSIFIEDFILIKDPKDFEEIENQTIKLQFNGNETSLFIEKGKSVLESALDAGIELPYSCQTGNCSTCKGILKTGDLKMIGMSHPRTDLAADEFLLCCSYPLNDKVVVAI